MITTLIHLNYCANCPSRHGQIYGHDPESLDYMSLPDGEKQKYVFPCAWRPTKLCKGICEDLGYVENLHSDIIKDLYK
jgi:hypothetical protein